MLRKKSRTYQDNLVIEFPEEDGASQQIALEHKMSR